MLQFSKQALPAIETLARRMSKKAAQVHRITFHCPEVIPIMPSSGLELVTP
jgi:hypothetical protein